MGSSEKNNFDRAMDKEGSPKKLCQSQSAFRQYSQV